MLKRMVSKVQCVICPSILNADLSRLHEECTSLLAAGAHALHLDVMDGHFVPNLSFGAPVVQCIRQSLGESVVLDVHLMVSNPAQWVTDMQQAGASQFTFHLEALSDRHKVTELISKVKSANMKVGIAIKPDTAVAELMPFIGLIDNALIMTVHPGFGGQKFMSEMLPKVRELRRAQPNMNIQVDGGVGVSNVLLCAQAGANAIVSGTGIIKSEDRAATIQRLSDTVQTAIDSEFPE